MSFFGIALWAAAFAQQGGADGQGDRLSLLHLRDRSIASLAVRFEFTMDTKGPERDVLWNYKATYYRNGTQEAVHWLRQDLSPGPNPDNRNGVWVWNGAILRDLVVTPRQTRFTVDCRRSSGTWIDWHPRYFTHCHGHIDWSQWFQSVAPTFLGREVYLGRSCCKYLWDPAGAEGSSSYVMLLWMDLDESLLVLKQQRLVATQAPESPVAPAAVRWKNQRWSPTTEMQVNEVFHAGAYWYMKEGRYIDYEHPNQKVTMSVDPESFEVNKPVDEVVFNNEPQGEAYFEDRLHGLTFYKNPQPGRKQGIEFILDEGLAAYAGAVHMQLSPSPEAPQPVMESSCGPWALYVTARLTGSKATLTEILAKMPRQHEGSSVQDVISASEQIGMPLRALHVDGAAPEQDRPYIAVVKSDGHPNKGGDHFAVVSNRGGTIHLLTMLTKHEQMPMEDFKKLWTGLVLVDASASLNVAPRSGSKWLLWVPIIALGLACGYVLTRGRRKSVAVALVMASLATGGLARCGKPEGDPSPPGACSERSLRFKSESHRDFGTIKEGPPCPLEFQVVNSGRSPISIRTRTSCGCMAR